MTIFGSECSGRFFLLSGDEIIGDYSSPVEVTETYLGDPFVGYSYLGIANPTFGSDPRPRFNSYVYSGSGAVVAQLTSIDKSNPWTITPPQTELGLWTISWSAYAFYQFTSYYYHWEERSGGSLQATINRYNYSINPAP